MTKLPINTYLGFTSQFKPMQAAKKEATLDKFVRLQGEVMTQKELVYSLLSQGYTPMVKYNHSYYSNRTGEMTKPKDQYRLDLDGSHYVITKTEYDFANYILDNNFLDESVMVAYVANEQQTEESAQLAEEQRIQKEREEQARIKQEAETKRKAELQAKQSAWIEEGKQYMTNEVKEVIITLVNDNWNTISKMTTESKEDITNTFIKKFTMWLGNRKGIEANLYRYANNESTYTIESNPNMYFEQQFLMLAFGLNKGDHGNTINAKIKAFYNGTVQTTPATKEDEPETVYQLNPKTNEYTPLQGRKMDINGFTCYLVTEEGKYKVIEAQTGLLIGQPGTNKTEIVKKVRDQLNNNSERVNKAINNAINKYGLSPLYDNKKAV